jgi:uncharacterized membrane protein YhiD involved in acid resistance
VRDTRDTAFVFLALAGGMAIGTGYALLAIAGVLVICLVAVYLYLTSFGARFDCTGLLQFRGRRSLIENRELQRILHRFSHKVRLLSLNPRHGEPGEPNAEFDCAFEIELRDETNAARLLSALQTISGMQDVNLVMREQQDEF